MLTRRLPYALPVLLAACGSPAQNQPQPTPSAASSAAVAIATPTPPAKGSAHETRIDNPLYSFTYSWPAAADAIPALKAWLAADEAKSRASIADQAKDGKADAARSGFDFNPYESSVSYAVVTDLPGWLSLSGMSEDYSGGAHPNHGPIALLWDKTAGRQREALDLFTSKAALSKAIRAPFCDAIDKERARRRGETVNRNSGDEFDTCLDPVASTLILGSTDRRHFTRLGILLGPYEAGPYAEGDYEVTLPVTPAVLAAVKPEYRQDFATAR